MTQTLDEVLAMVREKATRPHPFLRDVPDRIAVWREIADRHERANYNTAGVPIRELREMIDVIEGAVTDTLAPRLARAVEILVAEARQHRIGGSWEREDGAWMPTCAACMRDWPCAPSEALAAAERALSEPKEGE